MGLNTKKLILFDSAHHSIKSEKVLGEKKISYQMAAVPPEISADCGAAVTLEAELEEILSLFKENDILVEAIYQIKENKDTKNYKKVYSSK